MSTCGQEGATASAVVVEEEDHCAVGGAQQTLKLTKEDSVDDKEDGKGKKKVVWTEGTVDNEHLGRKKSKCCCVYVKPHKFKGDPDQISSDESDGEDECDHCPGHHGKDLKKDEPPTSS
jgi:hypothetical protein